MHSMHKTASLRHLFLVKDLFISTLEVFFICNFEFQYETAHSSVAGHWLLESDGVQDTFESFKHFLVGLNSILRCLINAF